jgi:hypothetical protein
VAVSLHAANEGFDGRTAAQFALNGSDDTTLLTRDEEAMEAVRRFDDG